MENGMRRYWKCAIVVVALSILSATSNAEQGLPANLWGANVDIAEILPQDPLHVSTNRGDLFAIARLAGFNALRVTAFAERAPGERGTSYSQSDWHEIGLLAAKRNITLIVPLELSREEAATAAERQGSADQRSQFREKAYERKTDLILKALLNTGCRVIADLRNEPELSDQGVSELRALAGYVRREYPGVLLTVGGWKVKRPEHNEGGAGYIANYPDDGAVLAQFEDIVSVHLYDEALEGHKTYGLYARRPEVVPAAVVNYLTRVRNWANVKPILITEFGSPNGVLPTRYRSDLGPITPQVQASTMAGVVQGVLVARGIGVDVRGALAWIMVPRGGDRAIHDESNEWSLSIIDRVAGVMRVFPAFWTFCRFAAEINTECVNASARDIGLRVERTQ